MDRMDENNLNRRDFLQWGVQAGFALAVLSELTWAVSPTSSTGINISTVAIPTQNEAMPAYCALPLGPGPFSAILVIHEIFGLHEYIQDVCRRFAHQGFIAVAPSLFFRHGDVTQIQSVEQIMTQILSKLKQEQVISDLNATFHWMKDLKESDSSQIGVTGFCWGGRQTWLYASYQEQLKAAAAWYGPLSTPEPSVMSRVSSLKVPVLGLYGGKDTQIPKKDVDAMQHALSVGRSASKIILFPKASHGFHADYRPTYDAQAAVSGWNEMMAWFKAHGIT